MIAPIATTDAIDHPCMQERHEKRRRLRELAHWYREFVERAGNPIIWEARLRTAKELEREADTLKEGSAQRRETGFKSRKSTAKFANCPERPAKSLDE